MKAWTLGYPPGYKEAIRIPGNSKAPGGYVFKTKREALEYVDANPIEAGRYAPYRVELPGTWRECTTTSFRRAAKARHAWHRGVRASMPGCGVCNKNFDHVLTCSLLLVSAPFINPDTGKPA